MKILIVFAFALILAGCSEGGIGGPELPPCGDKLKNWDGDNAPCERVWPGCPPKRRCLFVDGEWKVLPE